MVLKVVSRIMMLLALEMALVAAIEWRLPYYWGNPYLVAKMELLDAAERPITRVVIGSSRMYRSVIPTLLDSLTGSPSGSTFNLAAPDMGAGQSVWFAEKFLADQRSSALHTMFLELQDLTPLEGDNMFATQESYWHSPAEALFACRSILNSDRQWTTKIYFIRGEILCSINAMIGSGHISGIRELIRPTLTLTGLLGVRKDGFRDLEDEQKNSPLRTVRDGLTVRRKLHLEQPEQRSTQVADAIAIRNSKGVRPSATYTERLQDLLDTCTARGIELIFVVQPKNNSPYPLALKDDLPSEHVVDLHDPLRYPDLYASEVAFDNGHFNKAGAKLFTQHLAEAIAGRPSFSPAQHSYLRPQPHDHATRPDHFRLDRSRKMAPDHWHGIDRQRELCERAGP